MGENIDKNLELKALILDNIEDFMCVVLDEDKNIIYPSDKESLKKYAEILKGKSDNEGIYSTEENDEWYELYAKTVLLKGQKVNLQYYRNVSRFKRLEREFKTDFTGISNRQSAIAKIDKYIEYAFEHEEEFCVMLSDINYFKQINDRCGHLFGDTVLRNVGKIINEHSRSSEQREGDIAGRFGGDEFFGVVKNISLEDSLNWRERAKHIIADYTHTSDDGLIVLNGVTMSIGLYHVNKDEIRHLRKADLSTDDIRKYIFDKCDENLYEDKAKDHFELDIKSKKLTPKGIQPTEKE